MDKTASQIIDALGGTCAVAKLCGEIRPPSVSRWRRDGIPQARLLYLKAIRPDVFGIKPERRSKKGLKDEAV